MPSKEISSAHVPSLDRASHPRRAFAVAAWMIAAALMHAPAQTATRISAMAQARQSELNYLKSIAGKKIIVGVQNKHGATPTSDSDRVAAIAGRTPAFWGADFSYGVQGVAARPVITAEGIRQWKAGAVVGLMYHACPPSRDELCQWTDIGGKASTHLTDAQWNELFTPGTAINKEWYRRMDNIAVYLAQFKAAGVVVLFRPFHEMNQCHFWWGCHTGPNGTVRLYRLMHDYLTHDKGLDNILWVWSVQDFPTLATDVVSLNPGPGYYDIATLDVYDSSGYTESNYEIMRKAAAGKPIAIAECEHMPTLATIASQPQWIYVMLWPDFIQENVQALPALYAAPNVLTLDRMPGWR